MKYISFNDKIKNFIRKIKYHKKTMKILEKNCYIINSNIPDDHGKIYRSKIDGSYIGRVGMEEFLYFLAKYGITEQIQNSENESKYSANIGFNPKERKWYGWSHRAIYGFGVGSRIRKGDSAYKPVNKKDMKEEIIRFWCNTCGYKLESLNEVTKDCLYCDGKGCNFCNGTGKITGLEIVYYFKNLKGEFFEPYPREWGRGEWVAKTLQDAKQMAIDFAMSVS